MAINRQLLGRLPSPSDCLKTCYLGDETVLTEFDDLVLVERQARRIVAKAVQTNGKKGDGMLEVYAAKAEGNLCRVLTTCREICHKEGLISTHGGQEKDEDSIQRRRLVAAVRRMAKQERARRFHGPSLSRLRMPSIRGYEVWEYAARSIVFQAFFKIPSLRAVVLGCTPEEQERLDADFYKTVSAYH